MTVEHADLLLHRIRKRLDELRPAMEADGGGVDIAELAEGRLLLRLRGACRYCPSQPLTIATITPALRDVVGSTMEISYST